jgi:nitrate reductase assembly molybdenum cofactor insertion protein NarJ
MTTVQSSFRDDLLRATRYRFVHALLRPPADGRRAELARFARELPAPERDAAGSLLAVSDDAAMDEAFRLLGPAGRVPVRASDFVEMGLADKGPILADIAGFYRAFGFSTGCGELPDHFAVLFDFLSFVALKQAFAGRADDQEQVEIAAEAERKLLADHVGDRFARFLDRLLAEAPEGGTYRDVARWLERNVLPAIRPVGAHAGPAR